MRNKLRLDFYKKDCKKRQNKINNNSCYKIVIKIGGKLLYNLELTRFFLKD